MGCGHSGGVQVTTPILPGPWGRDLDSLATLLAGAGVEPTEAAIWHALRANRLPAPEECSAAYLAGVESFGNDPDQSERPATVRPTRRSKP